ncbi:hypothetical protein CYY_007594 [Polysphondylium violaceum]|uniref:Uncharacterized protein n=1 Tax=Polysphondylium violaceum TaxID=133409 RepID=A0A8J4PQQ9_9MYCE|nr:hypothetical protein CYY_007594 [Polysphondylium violaceum]
MSNELSTIDDILALLYQLKQSRGTDTCDVFSSIQNKLESINNYQPTSTKIEKQKELNKQSLSHLQLLETKLENLYDQYDQDTFSNLIWIPKDIDVNNMSVNDTNENNDNNQEQIDKPLMKKELYKLSSQYISLVDKYNSKSKDILHKKSKDINSTNDNDAILLKWYKFILKEINDQLSCNNVNNNDNNDNTSIEYFIKNTIIELILDKTILKSTNNKKKNKQQFTNYSQESLLKRNEILLSLLKINNSDKDELVLFNSVEYYNQQLFISFQKKSIQINLKISLNSANYQFEFDNYQYYQNTIKSKEWMNENTINNILK